MIYHFYTLSRVHISLEQNQYFFVRQTGEHIIVSEVYFILKNHFFNHILFYRRHEISLSDFVRGFLLYGHEMDTLEKEHYSVHLIIIYCVMHTSYIAVSAPISHNSNLAPVSTYVECFDRAAKNLSSSIDAKVILL